MLASHCLCELCGLVPLGGKSLTLQCNLSMFFRFRPANSSMVSGCYMRVSIVCRLMEVGQTAKSLKHGNRRPMDEQRQTNKCKQQHLYCHHTQTDFRLTEQSDSMAWHKLVEAEISLLNKQKPKLKPLKP